MWPVAMPLCSVEGAEMGDATKGTSNGGNRPVTAIADILTHWTEKVTAAALAFEARWTLLALQRVDAALHKRFVEQRDLFWEARLEGSSADIAKQGAGLCRGYGAIVRAMEEDAARYGAHFSDSAYFIGQDPKTGLRVAVGAQKAAAERVRELYGDQVIWLSPDELAVLVASAPGLRQLVAAKKAWPGAEIMRVGLGYEPDLIDVTALVEIDEVA